ncbi:IQ domain-containing protein E isoform X1 [Manis pentadactyla]|uniref:IQ domain-containing protein E isoform X1 n=1 Tax=Manis pentadactyla TaxID=143292 RepID=UPI00255CA473|nr:IQ domain-containing protein E isoform X1 [Manis pentadactyla]
MAAGSRRARGRTWRLRAARRPEEPRSRTAAPAAPRGIQAVPPPCRWEPETQPRIWEMTVSLQLPLTLILRRCGLHVCRVSLHPVALPPPPILDTQCFTAGPFGSPGRLDQLYVVSSLFQKAKRKSFHKPPPTSPKSPYHSKPRKVASWRSPRTAASVPLGNRMSLTPQKLWLGSSKPGTFKPGSLTQPLQSDLTLERAWISPTGSSPDYVTETWRMKRSNLRRSASNGHVPGTPIYREKEDMYDEIIELKKSLHAQKGDVDLMRTKLRRLEEENSRKDRQIEHLLDAPRGPDFIRTLAEKRPNSGWVISGLKQRILKLEQQCKEKDNTISKLQTDMKTTNLEEMRIAMETYYEEIHRLQTLLASSETTVKRPPAEKKMGLKSQKKVSSALLSLSQSVQELTEENQSLKEDLDRVLSNSPTASRIKGYMEWSKPRLLRRIAELEKISLVERQKSHTSEVVMSSPPAQSASSSAVDRQPRSDHQRESERLRGAVRNLRAERSTLQAQLQERDLEVKQLLQTKADLQKELENVKENEKERRAREEALREEIQTLTKKFQELEGNKKEEKDEPMELSPETPEPWPSRPASRPSPQDSGPDTGEGGAPCTPSGCSDRRRDAAARTLQARWKAYKHKKKKADLDEVAAALQAAFRGHLVRVKLLSSNACGSQIPSLPNQSSPAPCVPSPIAQAEGDARHEEAITMIQSVFRAHLVRTRHGPICQRRAAAAPAKKTCAPATPSQPCSPPFLATCPAELAPLELQPAMPPPTEDIISDDSDEIIVAPALPSKKSASQS